MLEILTSLFGGGLTGLIGGAMQKIYEFKTKKLEIDLQKLKFDNELALRRVDVEIMDREFAGRVKVAEVEGAAKVEVADSTAFAASFAEPKLLSEGSPKTAWQIWLLVLVDVFKQMIRPSLTLYLCIITTKLYFNVRQFSPLMDVAQANALLSQIVNTVLYLTTTATLWWYGTRNSQKGPK